MRNDLGLPEWRIDVTQVSSNQIKLLQTPAINIVTALEDSPTLYGFGKIGLTHHNYIVESVTSNGETSFTIEGIVYDERTFYGTTI